MQGLALRRLQKVGKGKAVHGCCADRAHLCVNVYLIVPEEALRHCKFNTIDKID